MRNAEDAAPQIRRRSAGVPPAFRTRSAPVPHPFRTRSARGPCTRSAPVPHRLFRTGSAPVPQPFRSGSARAPANSPEGEKKKWVFFRLFWCLCAFGGVFLLGGGCFCQKTPRRTSAAAVPHAIRTVLRTCPALAPHMASHLFRTCSALVPNLCRTCAALVPHLCRTCAALVLHLCRNVGGSAARRPLAQSVLVKKRFEKARKTQRTVRFVLFEKTRENGAKNGAPRHLLLLPGAEGCKEPTTSQSSSCCWSSPIGTTHERPALLRHLRRRISSSSRTEGNLKRG